MFVKKNSACDAFVANDGCTIRELLHPKNDAIDLPYSLALATVDTGSKSYQHKLEQTEVYHILQGHGRMFIEKEGFTELFNSVKLRERYDIAVMSTKGMPVVAMRKARRSVSGILSDSLRKVDHFVTGSKSLW